jgi:hypothetical protein
MKTETGKSNISTVLGQAIPETSFEYSWDVYETPDEAKTAGKWPNDADILEYLNGIAERNALSSARAKIVNAHAETIRNTPEFKRSEFIKAAVAFGMSEEQATQLASSKL